ncbi:MAG TPA: peptide-methionine (S)-S-oxide reductase MsrA [Candidatus Lustribacter sp.]|jgi:peptide-methionine (S)-S-oxide reductase|nr:peptide-methionine (S)-S-oxide reductase MsrA [Candidatus Lustribacter sp.]
MTISRRRFGFVLAAALAAVLGLSAPLARPALAASAPLQTIVLAGGCFWGQELVFENLKGVKQAMPGYSGGSAATAHYELTSTGTTGHAESVRVTYDPAEISLEQILTVFFTVSHDPTELNYQGPDDGTQYRSAIFVANAQQRHVAAAMIARLTAEHRFKAPIVTKIETFHGFYPAEAYHVHYATLHPDDPYIVINDAPKLVALKKTYPQLVAQK